jgi:hypothetical protein
MLALIICITCSLENLSPIITRFYRAMVLLENVEFHMLGAWSFLLACTCQNMKKQSTFQWIRLHLQSMSISEELEIIRVRRHNKLSTISFSSNWMHQWLFFYQQKWLESHEWLNENKVTQLKKANKYTYCESSHGMLGSYRLLSSR